MALSEGRMLYGSFTAVSMLDGPVLQSRCHRCHSAVWVRLAQITVDCHCLDVCSMEQRNPLNQELETFEKLKAAAGAA